MAYAAPRSRYSSLSISLHWLMLLLIASVYACIELREFYPKGSDIRESFKMWHFMLGLTILLLVFVRIFARVTGGTPPISPEPRTWQRLIAKITHFGLYGLMMGMPIGGWLILSASGKPIPYFGLELPALVGPDKALAGQIKELHETFGTVGYYLIGLHAAAALFHHYFIKDNTLRRMMPGAR